jgi:hypothetical protein
LGHKSQLLNQVLPCFGEQPYPRIASHNSRFENNNHTHQPRDLSGSLFARGKANLIHYVNHLL